MGQETVAGLAGRRCCIARCRSAAVDAELVCAGLFRGGALPPEEMADPAVHLRSVPVGESGDVDMALGALEETVHRLFEEGAIDVSFRAFLTVAVIAGILGNGR